MRDSKIAWTHHTFNPWIGCSRVSAGCVHCYAETLNNRWGHANWGPEAERKRTSETYWRQPIAWNKEAAKAKERRRVFCASMADVFEDGPELDNWRAELWTLIEQTPWLDWLLLTKRPEKVNRLAPRLGLPKNVWIGTSVEDQAAADKRIPHLVNIQATVRFLSVEPMIGMVKLHQLHPAPCGPQCWLSNLDWVICGGESGPGNRIMNEAWATDLKAQCRGGNVAFFMKQMGGHPNKREDLEQIPEYLRIREYPRAHPQGEGK